MGCGRFVLRVLKQGLLKIFLKVLFAIQSGLIEKRA